MLMATIKVKFRPSTVDGCEGTVYYQVTHARKVRQIASSCRVYPAEWDNEHSTVKAFGGSPRSAQVLQMQPCIRGDIERFMLICRRLESVGLVYTVDDIIEQFERYSSEYSLFNYMECLIARLRKNGKDRTSDAYRAALNSFKKFRGGEDIMLDSIDTSIMESYEAWHRLNGNTFNTISFYIRILRAVYNRALEDKNIENRFPFRRVYTGVDKTVKRALPLRSIRAIKSLDLSGTPALDYARDMFLLSFYLRGMSFIDMAFLKKTDLVGGFILYRRHKTGQQLKIRWVREMQAIVDKYPRNETGYLLPIIRNPGKKERYVYLNVSYRINQSLKQIAAKAGIGIPLTLYVARHSWASVAKANGVPIGVISEGMGHDSETTTRIYLASLDASVVDRANSMILNSLCDKKR